LVPICHHENSRNSFILYLSFIHPSFILHSYFIHPPFILHSSFIHPSFILYSSFINPLFILLSSFIHPSFILHSSFIHSSFIHHSSFLSFTHSFFIYSFILPFTCSFYHLFLKISSDLFIHLFLWLHIKNDRLKDFVNHIAINKRWKKHWFHLIMNSLILNDIIHCQHFIYSILLSSTCP